jgi:type IV pilus assembly protein PilN
MSTLTTTRLVTLPQVNLLPPEIEQERRFRRTQFVLGAAVVASLGVVGVLFLAASNQVSSAQGDLADSKRETTKLEARANEYSQVPLVYAQVEAARAQLELAMGKEIRWSFYLNDLSLKIPSSVWLTTMTVTPNEAVALAPAPVAGSAAGYLVPGVGAVAFDGHALKHNDVAAWLDSLAKQKGYTQPYFTESVKEKIGSREVVRFKSQVTVTEDALSKRYIQKAGS